jgi:hypothetical protein
VVELFASNRAQSVIITVCILVGVINAVLLINTTYYYSGSILLSDNLEVDLKEIKVTNLDPTNTTINPKLTLTFNVIVPTRWTGEFNIRELVTSVYLNNHHIRYGFFHLVISPENQALYSGDNRNYTIATTLSTDSDKQVFYNASITDTWFFEVNLNLDIRLFGSGYPRVESETFTYEGVVLS